MSKFGFDVAAVRLTLVTEQTTSAHPEITDTPLDHALRYADLGWYVIPVRRDKRPIDGYGLNSATKDPAIIRKIWGSAPDAGIAIACEKSGLVVLDIDPRNGGSESLAQLEAEHGIIHSSVVSLTQGGGEHRFFNASEGSTYPGTLGAGLDIKHRGYVLVEPSAGEDGVYRWAAGKNPTKGSFPTDAPGFFKPTARTNDTLSVKVRPGSLIESPQTYLDLENALRALPPEADYNSGWLTVMQGMTRLADKERAYKITRDWSLSSTKANHTAADFDAKWRSLNHEDTEVTHKSIFYMADRVDKDWRSKPTRSDEETSTLPTLYGLNDYDLENLPPIKFIIPDWLPAGKLTLFSGHGGSGKSSVMLQLGVLLAAGGQQALGRTLPDEPQRVLFVSGEDEPIVNMTRLRGVLKLQPGVDRRAVDENLKFMNVAGCRNTTLVDFDSRTGKHTYTALYKHLHALCAEFKPDVIITDNNSILFGGNEIDRNQIQTYIHCVQNIYPSAAVVALHHVDKASLGREDGDGWSGSTQWHNAARARWTLSIINDEMTLFLRKSNYGFDGWRGSVTYDEQARAHKLGEFTRLTREQESILRSENKEVAKANAAAEREQSDRTTLLSAIASAQERYLGAYSVLQSLGGRYDAYKKVLTKLIDEGEVFEVALPPGIKGESNRQKTYLALRDRGESERYKI